MTLIFYFMQSLVLWIEIPIAFSLMLTIFLIYSNAAGHIFPKCGNMIKIM